jgi:N-methylhydantoinase A
MTWIAGIDVGGTFTDVVLLNTKTHEIRIRKVPTSARNQAESFLRGLTETGDLNEVDAIVHGTTIGTNALLERKGARTGLITSKGFRDVLELGRRTRPNDYGLTGDFQPLIPREHRLEVPERVDARGNEVVPLDEAALREAVRTLLAAGIESVAVMFMHSYVAPDHELAAGRVIEELWPNDYVSLSHRVLPEIGEFERVSTTAINAYLQPLLHHYLANVDDRLRASGYSKTFRIMLSNGGALNVANATRNACRSVLSGPAGGAIAASWIGRQVGENHVISADMGGTSFDVAVILDGEPELAEQKEFSYGIPSRIPMIDIETIGAGGGSIIYQDRAGMLHVGPESAGAEPGPISYARGGTRPTVTDANVLLGRLDIQEVLPGTASSGPAVRKAFEQLGTGLDTTAEGAADAAIRVIDLNMAGAIRKITLERGLDTRKFVLIPFGGAGPLHACSIAENLRIPRVLVPNWPGVTSALGCVLADIRYDDTWTVHQRLTQIEPSRVRALYQVMVERVMAVMREDGVPDEKVALRYEAALQYEGQTHRVTITLPSPDITVEDLGNAYMNEYRERYGVTVDNVPIRLVNLRVRASAPRDIDITVTANQMPGSNTNGATSTPMFFAGTWHEASIHQRTSLREGAVIKGPARITQTDSTTIVAPGWVAQVDGRGNIAITHEAFEQ